VTDTVVLTRGDRNSLFNILQENNGGAVSPAGTAWAMGQTTELDSLTFTPLKEAANQQMKQLPGKDLVLHLIEEDIYIDVTFISWASGSSGGGFSYERTTPN
jgi:hypothetical protein